MKIISLAPSAMPVGNFMSTGRDVEVVSGTHLVSVKILHFYQKKQQVLIEWRSHHQNTSGNEEPSQWCGHQSRPIPSSNVKMVEKKRLTIKKAQGVRL